MHNLEGETREVATFEHRSAQAKATHSVEETDASAAGAETMKKSKKSGTGYDFRPDGHMGR